MKSRVTTDPGRSPRAWEAESPRNPTSITAIFTPAPRCPALWYAAAPMRDTPSEVTARGTGLAGTLMRTCPP